jgi:hypothetical protein
MGVTEDRVPVITGGSVPSLRQTYFELRSRAKRAGRPGSQDVMNRSDPPKGLKLTQRQNSHTGMRHT